MINKKIQESSLNISSSVIGALVGFAIGGPVGAVVSATASPAFTITHNIFNNVYERRKKRITKVLDKALEIAKITPDETLLILESNENKADDLFSLLKMIVDTDSSIDLILSSIIGENLKDTTSIHRDRLLILSDAIRNMRSVHLRILKSIFNAGGVLSAEKMADESGIPIIELRSVVRDLELRGMIRDTGKIPIEWELRELGIMLLEFQMKK